MKLIGMFEINGSFVVNLIKNEKYSSGCGVGINFTFRNTENDLLDHIQTLLKDKDIESKIKDGVLMIVGYENLHKFVELLDKNGGFISIKRQEELLVFKKILYIYKTKGHLTKDGIKKIRDLKGR